MPVNGRGVCACRVRPAAEDGVTPGDWFNVFVLHQNRVSHTQSAKNLVKETHLARFLDYVVWGHEHECIPDAEVRRHAQEMGCRRAACVWSSCNGANSMALRMLDLSGGLS